MNNTGHIDEDPTPRSSPYLAGHRIEAIAQLFHFSIQFLIEIEWLDRRHWLPDGRRGHSRFAVDTHRWTDQSDALIAGRRSAEERQ